MKKVVALMYFVFFIFIILSSGCYSIETLNDGHKATTKHLTEHEDEVEVHIHADFKFYING